MNTQRIDGPGVQALHTQDATVKWSEWMDKCSVTYPPRMATRRHFTIDGVYVHAGKREGMWLGAVSFGFNVNFPIRDAIKIFVDECEKHNHKVKEIVFE